MLNNRFFIADRAVPTGGFKYKWKCCDFSVQPSSTRSNWFILSQPSVFWTWSEHWTEATFVSLVWGG